MSTQRRIFEAVGSKADFPAMERALADFWKEDDTFRESLRIREGAPRFVFYEGPPTANGNPGTHHLLARAFKDVFGRYQTMKGRYVERKAGWDTHGLPVELEVEKELKISGKQQIEDYGIAAFNEKCKESVHRYVANWRAFSERMAFWQDYDNAYWTYHSDYIQSVWWAIKQVWDQGLVYKGFRVAPYCPRCMTPLSSHELSLGYQDDTPDPSVFVRFHLKDEPGTSVLAWTTTPWTLPGNVALAVGEDIDYVKVRQGSETLILAEARLGVLDGDHEVLERFRGRDLVGRDYEPLYPYSVPESGRAQYIVAADFVSTEDGTGVVHTSALYGADDLRLCQEKGIPFKHTVDLRGRFFDYVDRFAGLFVKEADPSIIDDLRERGFLYREETVHHTYPFCWRCQTPLIYYGLDSWYIRTTDRRDALLKNNDDTNWVPEHVKEGRMGDWLKNNVDWALSRSRYWGTPLPVWICEGCGEQRCIESAAEVGLAPDADLHRPFIDGVTLECGKCRGMMRRVPDVIDCWFDSGAMPFAQRGYPQANQELFKETFPADFITEALDQTRGWFYSLLAESSLLFGRNSYKNVICLGLILDEKGQKSSKSRGNVMDPNSVFDRWGSDAIRWLFFTSPVGESYRVGPKPLDEVVRRFLLTLWNVYSFFVTYARIDGYDPAAVEPVPVKERPVLDRWLLSRLSHLVATTDAAMLAYDVNGAARPVETFVEDLSTWYVRRSRRRFWKSESDTDKLSAYQTLHTSLVTLSKVLAPFLPFLAEEMYRNLTGERSVHLADFPVADAGARDESLEQQMAAARRAVEAGLAARDGARLKVRQPLASAAVPGDLLPEPIAAIVREELNVKTLTFGATAVLLDTHVTEELRLEGLARELVRTIQSLRKESGFQIEDRISTSWESKGFIARAFEDFGDYLKAETLSVELGRGIPAGVEPKEVTIDGDQVWLALKRID
ncbi:MAG TPA: isoleucine--tRNA ligase [Candidatus Dormibacteraeota bacterium]|nr:isoleucine--tRNA ligase [Candidatus Dormibacteraeota bacterium]